MPRSPHGHPVWWLVVGPTGKHCWQWCQSAFEARSRAAHRLGCDPMDTCGIYDAPGIGADPDWWDSVQMAILVGAALCKFERGRVAA